MAVATTTLFMFLACAIATGIAGAWLVARSTRVRDTRATPLRGVGWALFLLATAGIGTLALAHLSGRFGAAQLWFRAPTFHLSALALISAATWWFAQPTPRLLRIGLPAVAAGVLALGLVALRLHGTATPIAMLMPTMNAAAPELTWYDETGNVRSLAELQGKVVLLNFWATWCAPCRKEMPLLARMQREHAEQDFVVLYISLEDQPVLDRFLAVNRFDGTHGRLQRAADFYDAGKYYPLSYLIGRGGQVEERWSGRPNEKWLDTAIRAAL
jgi:cytochrome c biogenesis protein CcmG, thiol:disulfide interchange protein DsbE